jgi:hypothetical protein
MSDVIDMVWKEMQKSIDSIQSQVVRAKNLTERAETAGGVEAVTLANAPLAAGGSIAGDLLFITNGRKVGEGAGAGTGTLCYYNTATDSWFRVGDDTAVAI